METIIYTDCSRWCPASSCTTFICRNCCFMNAPTCLRSKRCIYQEAHLLSDEEYLSKK
ncbi:hypothetical protein QJS04_geneDACA015146 [Acorus gramineus]|uniref:Uncharacterized protein n=1 Tax=Acorus gramineus TaxID=55184 RepID=A0AAV9BUW8_ACOGR|nr:hypothetical protein QJS04_geneDACA015146 [Acorus gramineus]